jgi:hypothetical protein
MTAKTLVEQLQALEDMDKESNPPIAPKQPINPILDQLKQSSFQPDIHSYVTLDAKVYEDKSYFLEMHAKYQNTEMEIWLHRQHGDLEETMKFLKNLNQLTGEMLDFMKRHRLRSEVSED